MATVMHPGPPASPRTVRVAALADLHFGRHPVDFYQPIFADVNSRADVLAVCGDLTDHGRPDEAEGLVRLINQALRVPVVAVLGNHDCEAAEEAAITRLFRDAGMHVLDGDSVEILGVGFAGIKGFCGGFGVHALGPWGEAIIKAFVQETIAETLKLETALARLKTLTRIALLHYSPVAATVAGEPPEIFPFLGSSRMEEPLLRYDVTAVFHGHAHHGRPEGHTSKGAPVFNVSLPLLHGLAHPENARVIEVDGYTS
jgi:Icc-related predicted phosphoesterase